MNFAPEDLDEVLALLKNALALPAEQRAAWLDTLDASRPRLKTTLAEFLQRHAEHETADILDTLSHATAAGLSGLRAPAAGNLVGPYRLLRAVGEGGMSSVWLAEREDGVLKRKVALKLPHWWALSKLTERAAQERDILASLEHPHIARLYDAGSTADGRPYLALEFIEGKPIDVHCGEHQLDTRARVELAVQVARAVAHAHSRLVVHRDLKPSNILVDAQGQVHLLDFGIARLLEEGNAASKALTRIGARVLTLEYASPEQITGENVSTGSDVYSLGVVLYELLTGRLPYTFKSSAATDWEILSSEIPAPSSVARDAASTRQLRGDLDVILLKALKKERAERYASAAAFADDLENYLRGDPVLAQPDSAVYRARKFAQKNRVLVGAVAAVIAALAAGLFVATWQLRVARAEKKHAEEVKEFVASIFRSADPYFTGKQEMTAAEVLTLARGRIDKEMASQPASSAELLAIVGEAQSNLARYDEARATLDAAVKQADAADSDMTLYSAQAQALVAGIDLNEGNFEAAKQKVDAMIPILRGHGKAAARSLVNALAMRGFLLFELGDRDQSLADTREAVNLAQAELGPAHSETILVIRQLAQAQLMAGQIPEALQTAKRANDAALASFGSGGRNGLLVETEDVYGRALVEAGQVAEGIAHLQASITNAAAVFGENSGSVATKLTWLARAQMKLGDLRAAIASLERGRKAASNELEGARLATSLGNALVLAREADRATEVLAAATDSLRRLDTTQGSWLPNATAAYGAALVMAGKSAAAERVLKDNITVNKAQGAALAETYNGLGLVALKRGDAAAALASYEQALPLAGPEETPNRTRAAALTGIGAAQLVLKDWEKAEAALKTAEATNAGLYQRMTPPMADVAVLRGQVALEQKRAVDAQAQFARADEFWKNFAPASAWAAEAAYLRAPSSTLPREAGEGVGIR